jgi:hypothetical protein
MVLARRYKSTLRHDTQYGAKVLSRVHFGHGHLGRM